MAQQHYPFYDTAILGTSAQVVTMFTSPEGYDSTHQAEDTNMRLGGQFAGKQKFTLERIIGFPDIELAEADVQAIWKENYIKVIVENKNVLQVPLRLTAAHSSFGGHFTQGTAANRVDIGLNGVGFELRIPIVIMGGQQFKVELHQITVLSQATQLFKLVLDGLLDE